MFKEIAEEEDREWKEHNPSGKLFMALQKAAQEQGVDFSLKNKSGIIEQFNFGGQHASFTHHLHGGAVGESSGKIKDFVESYHYKRYSWWKNALDTTQAKYEFLDTPVAFAGHDITDKWEAIFVPNTIIEKYNLVPVNDLKGRREMRDWINEKLVVLLKEKLAPHFTLQEYDNAVRMVPLTEEAKQSRTEDNDVYREALQKIKEVIPELEALYQSKSDEINKKNF
jgi:hypothetical protein